MIYTTLYFLSLLIRSCFRYIQLCHNVNISGVDSFSTQSDGTKGLQQRKGEGYDKDAGIGYQWMCAVGFGRYKVSHLGTHPWTRTDLQCCSINDDSAWDLFYNVIFLDPLTNHPF
jgi:hypothetical protein